MKTQNISPAFTGSFVVPSSGTNKKFKFMYNQLSDLVKKNQVSANFWHDRIEIMAEGKQAKQIKKGLNKTVELYYENGKAVEPQNKTFRMVMNYFGHLAEGAKNMFKTFMQ